MKRSISHIIFLIVFNFCSVLSISQSDSSNINIELILRVVDNNDYKIELIRDLTSVNQFYCDSLGFVRIKLLPGYDYSFNIIKNEEIIGTDRFTTKGINNSTRLIREVQIQSPCKIINFNVVNNLYSKNVLEPKSLIDSTDAVEFYATILKESPN
jgi:hypothetical protein